MANNLQIAGAALPPSDFAPLHVNRMATGLWPNTNPLRDASTNGYTESNYGGKKDSLANGLNTEISTRLTLIRRPGCTVYNTQNFPPINRFYGWNTFTLTDEAVRVMADTAGVVYDATSSPARPNTKLAVFTKSPGAGSTYFLGVGNTLYFTNGVDNMQLNNATGAVTKWGIDGPTTAPTVSQTPISNPYPGWLPATAYGSLAYGMIIILDGTSNTVQFCNKVGTTGSAPPATFGSNRGDVTPDNTTSWFCLGTADWRANHAYASQEFAIVAQVNLPDGLFAMTFSLRTQGTSGPNHPLWTGGLGSQVTDGTCVWQNVGKTRNWGNVANSPCMPGTSNPSVDGFQILDPSGYVQTALQTGVSGAVPPDFSKSVGGQTVDGAQIWKNTLAYAVAATAPRQYGYAFYSSANTDLSNMSPASTPISVIAGQQVIVQGTGSQDPQVDTVVIYRTAQGGSTFLELARIPITLNASWSYNDSAPDSALNAELQAQVGGEGTPLPAGATCLAYHAGRIFAGVDNVVYISSGPDAVVSGSSGNAGFDTTFTCQSKIIRFWVNSLGVIVLTLRDAYIIQGTGVSTGNNANPFYISTWLENLPLLHYDALAVLLSTAYIFGGQRMVQALDPGSGITEESFPIAPFTDAIDPTTAYLTMHTGGSGETALYLGDGALKWYRMAPTSAPEQGSNWSPRAEIQGGMSALQSTEILPGQMGLLIGPPAAGGQIKVRDKTTRTDAGIPYVATADYNPIVLANPGQLAGLAWMTLKCAAGGGTEPELFVLLDEVNGPFETVPRTRQDPPNLPPSTSILSSRHSLIQNQKPVWCQTIKFALLWPATDTPDELLTYTIFGQTWQEQRSQ